MVTRESGERELCGNVSLKGHGIGNPLADTGNGDRRPLRRRSPPYRAPTGPGYWAGGNAVALHTNIEFKTWQVLFRTLEAQLGLPAVPGA